MPIHASEFKRISRDGNGSPRYIVYFGALLKTEENYYLPGKGSGPAFLPFHDRFSKALDRAGKYQGKAYKGQRWPGHVVFQAKDLKTLVTNLNNDLLSK